MVKKILLGLFLVLALVSCYAPKHRNLSRLPAPPASAPINQMRYVNDTFYIYWMLGLYGPTAPAYNPIYNTYNSESSRPLSSFNEEEPQPNYTPLAEEPPAAFSGDRAMEPTTQDADAPPTNTPEPEGYSADNGGYGGGEVTDSPAASSDSGSSDAGGGDSGGGGGGD